MAYLPVRLVQPRNADLPQRRLHVGFKGGHILLLTLEGIRRRDFSLAFKERFIQVGLVFLLALFAYVMYNDVVRLLPTHS